MKLKQIFPCQYESADGCWSATRIDDPELKPQDHRLSTGTLWSLHSLFKILRNSTPRFPLAASALPKSSVSAAQKKSNRKL